MKHTLNRTLNRTLTRTIPGALLFGVVTLSIAFAPAMGAPADPDTKKELPGDPARDWSKHGLKVTAFTATDTKRVVLMADEKGRRIRVSSTKPVSDAVVARLLKQKGIYHGWKFVEIDRIEFLVAGGIIDAHVITKKVVCGGRDITRHVPAGILLTEADALEYNFRITVKNVFIRIKGLYSGEAAICGKISAALANPRDYARRRDPEYVLRKLEQLEARLEKLMLHQKRLQHAVITLHNKGFFSGPKPPQHKVVEQIVALRHKEPNLKTEQIAARMLARGVRVSAQEVELILNVYFNVYKK